MLELTDVPSQPPLLLQTTDTKWCIPHRVTVPAPTGTIMAPLCASWVTSISKALPKDVPGNRGSSRARHHPHTLPWHCTVPPHAQIILQNITGWADGEGQLPLLPKGPREYLRCVVRTGKISFTSQSFSFSNFPLGTKPRQALGAARPWQEAAAAAGVITTLQKAPGCHFRFHGNKYRITANRPWCFMGFEAFYHL